MAKTREELLANKRAYQKAYYSSLSPEEKAIRAAKVAEFNSNRVRTPEQIVRKNEINRLYMERKARANGIPKRLGQAAWKKANPAKVRANSRRHHLKKKFGMTEADYEALIHKQNGKCAICFTTDPTGRNGKWHIDHCHTTGIIRGLLCGPCNQAIGLFKDDAVRIQNAANYLAAVQA